MSRNWPIAYTSLISLFFSKEGLDLLPPVKTSIARVTFLQKRRKKHITDFSFSYIFDVNDYICVIRCTCDIFLILWQAPFLQTDKKQLRQKSTSTFLTVVCLCEQSIQDCPVKSVIISLVVLASFCSCFDFCEMERNIGLHFWLICLVKWLHV